MSRKSLPKKDSISWFLCSKCDSFISAKDRDRHVDLCAPNASIEASKTATIKNKQFFSSELHVKPVTEDLNGINEQQLKRFIFLHESVINLCEFVLGDFLLISSSALPNAAPIVRCVWPLLNSNSSPTSVYVCESELNSTWKPHKDEGILIQKLTQNSIPASSITLSASNNDDEVDEAVWKDLKKVLAVRIKGNVFRVGNSIEISFFNKSFSFTISKIDGIRNTSDEISDLIEQFKSIELKNAEESSNFIAIGETQLEYLSLRTKATETADDEIRINKRELIGGMDDIVYELSDYLNTFLSNEAISKSPFSPRSVLIHGQHGSGKTLLCDAVTENIDALVIKINATDVFSKFFGETEANLILKFDKAFKQYPRPSVIVIEELQSICPKDTKEDSARRVQMAFLNILDEIRVRKDARRLFMIATTSNIDAVNLAVRRFGRLDVEIEIPVPDPLSREGILVKQLCQTNNELNEDDVRTIAANSHGFIAADLANLIAKAAMNAAKRSPTAVITLVDIQHAYGQVVPSAMKEIVIKCPNVKWSDIGGQDELKLQLKQAIEWPLLHPETFTRLGIAPPRGILMFGPPGCSKTMIAKALATESKVNFLSIKGPELFSMWVGESERAVRDLFHKARQVAPAIIFFDEIDAIGGERSASASGSSVKERVLTQLLTEMDGVNALTNVTIVAATNRPDLIDKAIMRPGRLDRIVYVRLPDAKTRREIFCIKLNKMPVATDVNVDHLVDSTDGYSGAEIQAICQEAALSALEENLTAVQVERKHFDKALEAVKPRTSSELLQLYEDYLKEKSNR